MAKTFPAPRGWIVLGEVSLPAGGGHRDVGWLIQREGGDTLAAWMGRGALRNLDQRKALAGLKAMQASIRDARDPSEFRRHRRALGWTQAQAAEAVGYQPSSRSYIADVDLGKVPCPAPVLKLMQIYADPRFPAEMLPVPAKPGRVGADDKVG